MITKSDDLAAGVPFVYHEYDYSRIRQYKVLLPINHKNYNFREKMNSQVAKEREICIKILTKEKYIVSCHSEIEIG